MVFTFFVFSFFFSRAEELETALMEMVKQDNRRQLSARVYHYLHGLSRSAFFSFFLFFFFFFFFFFIYVCVCGDCLLSSKVVVAF